MKINNYYNISTALKWMLDNKFLNTTLQLKDLVFIIKCFYNNILHYYYIISLTISLRLKIEIE